MLQEKGIRALPVIGNALMDIICSRYDYGKKRVAMYLPHYLRMSLLAVSSSLAAWALDDGNCVNPKIRN